MKSSLAALAVAAGLSALASGAHATAVTINFDAPFLDFEPIESYYAGGAGAQGTGPGPNLGVTFSADAVALCDIPVACGGLVEGAPSHPDVLLPQSDEVFADVAGGFSGSVSLSVATLIDGSIRIWSGVGGTGALLGEFKAPSVTTGCGPTPFCPFSIAGADFAGVAHSLEFRGFSHDAVFDDLHFANLTLPGGVPEPSQWALMIAGLGLSGLALRRRRAMAAA